MRKWRSAEKHHREVWVLEGVRGGGHGRRGTMRGTGVAPSSLLGLPGSPE